MPKKQRPLPKQPGTPFKRKDRFGSERDRSTLMADEMAMAMAEGRLEEFIESEIPDSEHARKLLEMMMGMTGMSPVSKKVQKSTKKGSGVKVSHTEDDPMNIENASSMPSKEIMDAVKDGSVGDLVDLLRKEHDKRNPGSSEGTTSKQPPLKDKGLSAKERTIIDELIKISKDNSVSLDWITLRALQHYIKEYKKTGKL